MKNLFLDSSKFTFVAILFSCAFTTEVLGQSNVRTEFNAQPQADFNEVTEAFNSSNILNESTYFDNNESSVNYDGSYGEDSMARIDAIYETLPESRTGFNPTPTNRGPQLQRTFTILGGFAIGDMDDTLEDDLLAPLVVSSEESGYALSFAKGRRHRPWLRSEFEFAIRDNDESALLSNGLSFLAIEADTLILSLMKNVIFEWNNQSRFTPYGGVGIGISYVDIETGILSDGIRIFEDDDDDTVFSYQAIAGVATEIRQGIDFIFEYRFFSTTDVEFNGDTLGPANVNNLFFGVKLEY